MRLLVQLTKPEAGNTVYDPTAGSGGFLIQAHQYVEEQGQNPNDLHLYGQDSNGTVWSICNMNMILHNITRFTIENGDTLEDPQILENGRIRKFDRVLANPPFSQNYSRASMKFTSRFREWCPETGKKADLMFVQHMPASLRPSGHMATIMPHGVLFRGGKEKLIREILIADDVIEAIISLPPGLFYGTGIPACVVVCNKSKPDALKGKVLFINADREYAEGKNQNKLRPEDVEKIDFVFTHKREIPKYSRLVDRSEIVETHEYNLNIRRYVDNTPEPEDVEAHLIGGIPETEVEALSDRFGKFSVDRDSILQPDRPDYLAFRGEISSKGLIGATLDADTAVLRTAAGHGEALGEWWSVAAEDFAKLRHANNGGATMPAVRLELLTTLKECLVPLGVLDEFQSAGVFVNWWQQIRYDLKTIVSIGWHHTLIPDSYLVSEFFQREADEIETLEAAISQSQSELSEAVVDAQEVAGFEPDEDEKVTASTMKKALKELLDDLEGSSGESAEREREALKAQDVAIKKTEGQIKTSKATVKERTVALANKLLLKRVGGETLKEECQELLTQIDSRVSGLDPQNKTDKRKLNALNKDRKIIEARMARADEVLAEIGSQLSGEEAKKLILKKAYDLIRSELDRYVGGEKRALVHGVEDLWRRYAKSARDLEATRAESLETLAGLLVDLGYTS